MTPDPEKVRVWEARAPAYDWLCHHWEIFSLLSNRLIDFLPVDLRGPVLDIGAGSGLTSELLLARHPHCEAILIEPSAAMLNIARQKLAGRSARFFAGGLGDAPAHDVRAVAALASASMHFLDLEPAFATLAGVIAPGGHVAFNLWWHHWEETAGVERMSGWRPIAQAVCEDAHLPPPTELTAAPPMAKTREELMSASRRHGFQLLREHCDEDVTPVSYGVDFRALDAEWPAKGCKPDDRLRLLEKMHERAQGKFETLVSTRFLFRRTASRLE